MNIVRPGGTSTEMGTFYFCRHPLHLAGLAKVAEAIFVINVLTGVCVLHANIKSIDPKNRTQIRHHLNRGTLHKGQIKYIYKDHMLEHFSELYKMRVQDQVQLDKEQISKIKSMAPRS